MKRIFFLFLIVLTLSSCASPDGRHTVTFVDGSLETSAEFGHGSSIVFPDPIPRENYSLVGWSYEQDEYSPVKERCTAENDITLYAFWRYDYEGVTNKIFDEHIKMNLAIRTSSYNTLFGTKIEETVSVGSAVIFDEDTRYYYLLTNSHVTERAEGYSHVRYTALDCYGNSYSATLLAAEPSYDLAIVRIEKGEAELYVATLADASPLPGDVTISLGAPEGLHNSVTYGRVEKLSELSPDAEISKDIDFAVIWHTAPIDHGSSGGALLDASLSLAGVNFAIVTHADTGEFLYGITVPIEKVKEFLELYY